MKRIVFPKELKEEIFDYEKIERDTIIGIVSKGFDGSIDKSLLIRTDKGVTAFSTDLDIKDNWFSSSKPQFIKDVEALGDFVNAYVFETGGEALRWLSELHI